MEIISKFNENVNDGLNLNSKYDKNLIDPKKKASIEKFNESEYPQNLDEFNNILKINSEKKLDILLEPENDKSYNSIKKYLINLRNKIPISKSFYHYSY
jgi:hypothetical protein